MSEPAETPAATADEPCETCVTGWGVILAVAFAGFAAYCAADFATGGRLTAWLLALLPRRAAE